MAECVYTVGEALHMVLDASSSDESEIDEDPNFPLPSAMECDTDSPDSDSSPEGK